MEVNKEYNLEERKEQDLYISQILRTLKAICRFLTNLALWLMICPCDGLASHSGGSRNTPSRFMLQKPEISAGLMSLLGS